MNEPVDELVRSRIRAIRQHLGWSLDDLAARSGVGASTISRIETGHRSISFDVLVPLARELDVSIDELVTTGRNDDIVIHPEPTHWPGMTMWSLSRPGSSLQAVKIHFAADAPKPEPQIHPGHDFMFVLSGTVRLTLGAAEHTVSAGQSAEFSTMTPHAVSPVDGPADILMVLDRDGAAAHINNPA